MALNQPDIEKFLKQSSQLEARAYKLAHKATKQRELAEKAAEEFRAAGEFSQETCEAMVPLSVNIIKKSADITSREGVFRGYSWFFLNEGMSEGDGSPCDC